MHQRLDGPALPLQIEQHQFIDSVPIPHVMGSVLVVPPQLSRVCVESHY
jgi:hypothetical protein